jgi:hypothetical protein
MKTPAIAFALMLSAHPIEPHGEATYWEMDSTYPTLTACIEERDRVRRKIDHPEWKERLARCASTIWTLLVTLSPSGACVGDSNCRDGHIVHNTHANGIFPTKEMCEPK